MDTRELGMRITPTKSVGCHPVRKIVALFVCGVICYGMYPPVSASAAEPLRVLKDQARPEEVTIYSVDSKHLLNRLHAAMFVRTARDGTVYGRDYLDPWLWPESQFLLVGERHQQAIRLLDEFLARGSDIIPSDPLRRALLQHDLWSVFDWLSSPEARYQSEPHFAERRALQVRLAQVIQRLALTAEQVQQLPDNYAAAVASKAFPFNQVVDQPGEAYLPKNLFQADGPWVLLGEHLRSAAPAHLQFVSGRSAFFVFINLPAGRSATLDYLERLQKFPNPLIPERDSQRLRLNPDVPQFPAGTQVALAREMLLIDDRAQLVSTRLIESLQLRRFGDIPPNSNLSRNSDPAGYQISHEFRFTRKALLSDKAGGLHAVSPDATEFLLFNAHPVDVFESSADQQRPVVVMQTCAGCHARRSDLGIGIHTVLAYRRGFTPDAAAPFLREYDRAAQEAAVMDWKRRHFSWGLLQGLWNRND